MWHSMWAWGVCLLQETFARIPNWLMSSLSNIRRGWVLGKKAGHQGPMVMGHVHAWHMQTSCLHKQMLRKVSMFGSAWNK